jgi:hypothetical protein
MMGTTLDSLLHSAIIQLEGHAVTAWRGLSDCQNPAAGSGRRAHPTRYIANVKRLA